MITPESIYLVIDAEGHGVTYEFFKSLNEAEDFIADNVEYIGDATVVKFVPDMPRAKRAKR